MSDIQLFSRSGNVIHLHASATSKNIQLFTATAGQSVPSQTLKATNKSGQTAFVNVGVSANTSAVIPVSGTPAVGSPMLANSVAWFDIPPTHTYVAVITDASSSEMYFELGQGSH